MLKNECIVLDNFGGFIVQRKSGFRTKNNLFIPPSKTLSFNERLKYSDGALLNHLVTKEVISQEEAQSHILNFTTFLNQTLENKSLVNLSGIGKFYYNNEKNLQFTPDANHNLEINSFGLSTLTLNPILREEKVELKVEVNNKPETESMEKNKKSIIKPLMKVAALLILTTGIVYQFIANDLSFDDFSKDKMILSSIVETMSSSYDSIVDNGKEEIKETVYKKAPAKKAVKEQPLVEEPKEVEGKSKIDKPEVIYKKAKKKPVAKKDNSKLKNTSVKKVSTTRKPIFLNETNYNQVYIITGAFGTEKNAHKLVNKLKKDNMNAKVLPTSNGMFRVGVHTFVSYDEATDYWLLIKKNYAASAWVLGMDEI